MELKKLVHKIIACVLVSAILVVPLGCSSETPPKQYEFENAADATLHMGAGWSLGNTLDAFNTSIVSRIPRATETCWGNPVATKELIKAVADAGFTTVRIPVTWTGHLDDEGNIDVAWLDRVQEVVDYCYAYKLYVIVNVHHDTGADEKAVWIKAEVSDYNANITKYMKLWTQIAERFESYDDHLLFEGYNEMLDGKSTWNRPAQDSAFNVVNKWAQIFVDAVRATGGNNANRNLIVSTYAASFNEPCLTGMVMPNDTVDNHLLVEIHMYSPYEFCSDEKGVVDKHTVFTEQYKKDIDKTFELVKSTFIDKGIPVVIGEFAATNKNNIEERVKYTKYYVEHAKAIGAAYIWWDNGVKKEMGLFSRTNYECWFPEIIDAIVK